MTSVKECVLRVVCALCGNEMGEVKVDACANHDKKPPHAHYGCQR